MRKLTYLLSSALVAVALVACGSEAGGGAGAGATSSEDKAFEGALKFARCMREQGLDFPDPKRGNNGMVQVGGGPGQQFDPSDPKTEAASKKCGVHLEQGGGPPLDQAQQAKFQDAFVKYARCMREQGIDMPDPKSGEGGGGIVFKVGDPNAPDPESPRFKQADKECHSLLAGLDEAVPSEQSP